MRSWWASFVLVAIVGGSSSAQSPAPASPLDAPSIGAWVGVAHHSPGGPFGTSVGNDLTMTGIRLTRTLHQSARWSLDYSGDIVPAAMVTTPGDSSRVVLRPCTSSPSGCRFRTPFVAKRTVYGFGGVPFGVQLRLAPRRSIQPFLTASGGALWFREPVPSQQAGRFNFAAEVGAGVVVRPVRALGVTVGYKLQHISNGGTSLSNPGIDNNMFYVGVVRSLHTSPASPAAQPAIASRADAEAAPPR